jgi:hypothetical protein
MSTHQADGAYEAPEGGNTNPIAKQIILVILIMTAAYLTYKVFLSEGGGFGNLFQNPKEVKLTYVPSDFNPSLDEETTLRVLSQPEKYRREFDDIVYNFNLSLLYHVANRMALPDSLKRRLEPQYQRHHEYLKTLYFNDFVSLKDTSAAMYETWYNDNANHAVQLFNEVAGKYTCFFVTQIMATMLKADGGRLFAKGKNVDTPCGIALNEGLNPMVERLKKKASIMDFSASRGLLKERVRKGIAELATFEYRSRLALDKTLQYKFLGFAISETDLRVEAISVVKTGFKLTEFFDVTFSPNKNTVFVTLPQPSILSHEVYPKIDKLDVGFLAGITGEEMNNNFNELRRQFRQEALEEEHVLEKAKMRADTVMQMLLGPAVKSMGRSLKLQVRFANEQIAPDVEPRKKNTGNTETQTPPQISNPVPPSDAPRPSRDKKKVLAN